MVRLALAALLLVVAAADVAPQDSAEAAGRQLSDTKPLVNFNKWHLMLIELLGLGLCGVDRFCLKECCCGVAKLLTLGGCVIWAAIDSWIVIINSLGSKDKLDSF